MANPVGWSLNSKGREWAMRSKCTREIFSEYKTGFVWVAVSELSFPNMKNCSWSGTQAHGCCISHLLCWGGAGEGTAQRWGFLTSKGERWRFTLSYKAGIELTVGGKIFKK